MAYKCYGVELLYPIDTNTVIGYQEYQTINGVQEKTDSILLIKVVDGGLEYSDPDGTERDYWLNRIGKLSNADFADSAKVLKTVEERQKLYNLLDEEQPETRRDLQNKIGNMEKALQSKQEELELEKRRVK